jgi:opacity protein-like surface antigen
MIYDRNPQLLNPVKNPIFYLPAMTNRSCILLLATVFILAFSLILAPPDAVAEGFQITPFLGYRMGGQFEEAGTGVELDIAEEESYGIVIDMDVSPGKQYEFLYSYQSSRLTSGGTVDPNALTDMDVEYFHIGGRNYWDHGAARTFLVGSVGATHFDLHVPNLSAETRFSISAGGGVELAVSERVGVRLEGRGFATFFDNEGAFFCDSSSGCVILVSTDVFVQFEVGAGLTFKF